MNIVIQRGKKEDKKGIAEAIAEAFYDDFKLLSKSKKLISSLLFPGIHPESFMVARNSLTNEVLGITGIADKSGYPISVPGKELKKELGILLGTIASKLMAIEFYRPKSFRPEEGYLCFVAVREKARRQGIAKKILNEIFEERKYRLYSLDVVEGNEKVIPLYEQAGFQVVRKDTSKLAHRRDIRFRYIMEKRSSLS